MEGLNRQILDSPFIGDAEAGVLPLDRVRLFVENQLYIVGHDIRSLAVMVGRSSSMEEASYFTKLQNGDLEAFKALTEMAEELDVEVGRLRLIPAAAAYTHYLAWLALYANPGEQAFALIVNLPVWGAACKRLSEALKKRYKVRSTGFLDLFGETPGWVEEEGLQIVERYLAASRARMEVSAKMIQGYEAMFWDAVYRMNPLM